MKDSVIRARVESALKVRASKVLAACGLEPSDAIRLFLQQVVAHQGLPFEVRSVDREPSMDELKAMKHQAQERDHRMAASADVSDGRMLLLRPEKIRGAKVLTARRTALHAKRSRRPGT